MSATEKQIQMAGKLYQAREAMKRLGPDIYPARIAEWQKLIKKQMAIANQEPIPSAMVICEMLPESDPFSRLWVLAAVIEMIEPTA